MSVRPLTVCGIRKHCMYSVQAATQRIKRKEKTTTKYL